ncbi:MAG: DUF1109 family protein [Kofleriaceae bacterium]|jgi:hypothetical protein|nr:DUF1109 family protein [Kofleriaceae bacterium]MBP9169035.1 DUF1109 family protein [Kofleriaceae bacterium]MBP9861670.1 DUF1109 family protein [Kofleriaceae bacterium]
MTGPSLPPLPPGLEAELATLRPVAPRRPGRQLAAIAAGSVAWAGLVLALLTVRRDLGELPPLWLALFLAAWAGGFAAPLALIVVPKAGDLLPRWRPAAILATLGTIGFMIAGLALPRSGPSSLHRGLDAWAGCLSTGLVTSLVPIALVAFAIRGAVAHAPRLTAAAIGAAAGALGGLMLHLHCPIADGVHVGVVHGGVALLAAALAAALAPRWLVAR